MSRRRRYVVILCVVATLAAAGVYGLAAGGTRGIAESTLVDRPPRMAPDYAGVVIPANVAPLNFCVQEPGTRYFVRIHSTRGEAVEVLSRTRRIAIPIKEWKALLAGSRGQEVRFDVYVRGTEGSWRRYASITNEVSDDEIDPYLVYRRINPMYNLYRTMSLRQRDLRGFDDVVVLDNASFGSGCMNCHSFPRNSPDKVVLQVRSGLKNYGAGMLLIQDGAIRKVDTRTQFAPRVAGFPAWHPSGRAVAFSINKVRQAFHCARAEVRDGVDLVSDMALYLLDSGSVVSTSAIASPDYLETYPAWSPAGGHLYFCRAPMLWSDTDEMPSERLTEVKYDLMRIGYDLGTGRWGELETVLSSDETGLSITQPRISPDGRFLAFCMSDYSTFPTFQPSSDLYLMDLEGGRYERMACSSEWAESWHCWSSNGRWLAFSSKREDGQFVKVYFSHVDEDGTARKPFLLPQKDPTHYEWFFKLYQLPELLRGPLPVAGEEIARAIRSPGWGRAGLPVTGATPRAGSPAAGQ